MTESEDTESKQCLKQLIQLFKEKQSLQEIDLNIVCK